MERAGAEMVLSKLQRNVGRISAPVVLLLVFAGSGFGQDSPRDAGQAPAVPAVVATRPATMPAKGQPLLARVIEVTGDVRYAPLGESEWKKAQVGDGYPPETKIQTGIRSSVKLQLGDEEPYSVVMIEQVGLALLAELYKTEEVKRVRIGVGHGRIRAGVAEGGLKSDFTVDSPVATLSKRGTWNFTLYYERDTDRFEVGLLDRGLVEVLSKLTSQTRTLAPGQRVTQVMRRWLDESQIVRNVAVADVFGQPEIDVVFNRLNTSGLGVVSPGNNRLLLINLTSNGARVDFTNLIRNQAPTIAPVPNLGPLGPFDRPEGFFGTGRGDDLIELIISENSKLARRQAARPGRYKFRRQVLERWLAQQQQRR